MTLSFDSRQIPAVDRAEAVRMFIASTTAPVNIDFPPARGPIVRGAITDLGSVRVCAIRSNAAKAERTARLARDDLEPSIFLGLQTTGASLIVQEDREAVLRPGELVLYDSTVPYIWADTGGLRKHLFRIPIERLALPRDLVRQVAAVTLSPGHPVADIAATYFQRIASRCNLLDQSAADAVSQPSIELVRALITTHLDASALAQEPLHATLQLRIMEYVRAHLSDPGLNAAEIAAEHHISVRHLYNVLARGGISLGDWMRTQRLEQSRQELARPEGGRITIAAVARRWGFTDPSTFGRLFRAAYGLSPSEWRAMNQRPLRRDVVRPDGVDRPRDGGSAAARARPDLSGDGLPAGHRMARAESDG